MQISQESRRNRKGTLEAISLYVSTLQTHLSSKTKERRICNMLSISN